eukprot:gene6299-gene4853
MCRKRAVVRLRLGEGVEELEFPEAREDPAAPERGYKVFGAEPTDGEGGDVG